MTSLDVRFDPALLAAAVVICATASFGVFRIRARLRHATERVRHVWLLLCGVEAGAAVWGTHLLTTLAFPPAAPFGFMPLAVMGALLVAVGGSTAIFAMAWSGAERMRGAASGALFALLAALIHFAPRASVQVAAVRHWEPIVVWLAAVSGVAMCSAAVLAAGDARRRLQQLAGAALLGGGVLATNLIGVSAMRFDPAAAATLRPGLLDHTAVAYLAVLVSALMIVAGWGAAYIDDTASRNAMRRMQRLANATREGIAVLADDRRIMDCNAAFAAMCGRDVAELRRLSLAELIRLDDDAHPRLDMAQEGEALGPDGRRVPVSVLLSFAAGQGEDGRPRMIATLTDLTEQRAAAERIRFLHEHDALTGLPNRKVLTEEIEKALASVRASDRDSLVLIEVRVTNSQEINSLYGHAAGDALLGKVAERLKRLAGGIERTARLGGNAFAFFIIDPKRTADAESSQLFFGKVMEVLRRPFVWNALALEPQVRIGVAGIPYDSNSVAELLLHAEGALDAPDDAGQDGVFFFRSDLHKARTERRALANDLRIALAEDQLTVFYQPQARAEDGRLCGFEALVRWTHPVHGFMPPDRFIGVAEESGLISQLGEWVLRRACLDAVSWPQPVPVAVNLSPLQVSEVSLPTRVHEILLETGLPPSRLELEITESALFRDYQRALDVLRRLKGLGVRIAMDDFGTGFSSLSTLQSFPFDKIKIDKSFVEGVGKLERSTVIVRAVLGIGRGLAIPVVAEGVETPEQMRFLRDELCAVVQGYHIGKPGPVGLHEALFSAPLDQALRLADARAA